MRASASARIERLFELGLDYVNDASITRDIARDAARAGFVNGVVAMLHSPSVQVIAEGVAQAQDADALWRWASMRRPGQFVRARSAAEPPRCALSSVVYQQLGLGEQVGDHLLVGGQARRSAG